jgi:MFS family permease
MNNLRKDEEILEEAALHTPIASGDAEIRSVDKKGFSLGKTFAALKHPNYKLWFWGQMVSLFGTWMQITAQGFLVFQLTHSPLFLGYVGFASGVPTWIFMLYGGVVADRFSRRKVLIITQAVMMVLAFVLAFLAFTNLVQPWHIIALAFLLGTANAFDAPARQALVPELVAKEDLTNAIALNSTMFNSATAVGPAVAGVTYAAFGAAWCFIINGLSFIGVIIALLMMRLKKASRKHSGKSAFEDLKEGVRYTFSHKMIRTLILIITMTSLFGVSFATQFPAWAVKELNGDASTNGLLQSARGIGALLCALFIASLGRFKYKGKLLTAGMLAFPALTILFSFITWLPLSLAMLLVIGFSMILIFNLSNAIAQALIPDNLRGRVMAVYSLTFFGLMPAGALIIGWTAEHTSEPTAIIIFASILLLFGMLSLFVFPGLKKLE